MGYIRTAIVCLAALLFCSEYVLSRPIQKRQTVQDQEQPQQDESEYILKFALLSKNSGKYVTMLENGSVVASGHAVRGKLDLSSQWYLHLSGEAYRLENVQNQDHYLAVAHRDNITALVAHNLSVPFTLDMMIEYESETSGDGEMHNDTNSSNTSESTFSFLAEWDIHSVDAVTNNVMLVRDDTECYLSFDHAGFPHQNLCSPRDVRRSLDIVFEPIF